MRALPPGPSLTLAWYEGAGHLTLTLIAWYDGAGHPVPHQSHPLVDHRIPVFVPIPHEAALLPLG